MLKDVFRHFWTYKHFGDARRFLGWRLGLALGLRPLIRFGQGVCRPRYTPQVFDIALHRQDTQEAKAR